MAPIKTRIWEAVRCARHNWLHLQLFKLSFDGTHWHVKDSEGTNLKFPHYPYVAFLEIEGYLRMGKWRLETGMTVIDAGAAVGEFSLYASRKVGPSGNVIMVEPDPENIYRAKALFDCNGGQPANLRIVPVALWKEKGEISFASGLSSLCSVVDVISDSLPDKATVIDVPAESLSSLASELNLHRVDFVKIDVEGAEVAILQNAQDFIRDFSPKFSIASYHPLENGITRDVIEPLFRKFKYQYESGFPSHLTTWAAQVL